MVSDDAIALLWHPAVEGPQARFEVRQRQALLGRGQSSAEGGIGITVDQYPIRHYLPDD